MSKSPESLDIRSVDSTVTALIVSFLLGEGEIFYDNTKDDYILSSEITPENAPYLNQMIDDVIKTSSALIAYTISSNDIYLTFKKSIIKPFYTSWYENGEKIYNKHSFGHKFSLETFILFLNMYGYRDLQGIVIKSSVSHHCKKAITFYLKKHLDIELFPYDNFTVFRSFKVEQLSLQIKQHATVRHIAHFFQMVTSSDIKKMEKIEQKELKHGKYL